MSRFKTLFDNFPSSFQNNLYASAFDEINSISRHALKKYLAEHNVMLLGGTTEEAPQAYKDIHQVMDSQHDLINIEGKIIPRIVRMSEE